MRRAVIALGVLLGCARGPSRAGVAPPLPAGERVPPLLRAAATPVDAPTDTVATDAAGGGVPVTVEPPVARAPTAARPTSDPACLPFADDALKATVLVGDSTVGFHDGLSRGMRRRLEPLEGDFYAAAYASTGIKSFTDDDRWVQVLRTRKPRVVLISLGTNNVYQARPAELRPYIERIVRKVAPAECVWIAPPVWKSDTGVIALLREHAAPCRFFDTTRLVLERARDGIHPSSRGGDAWAEAIHAFMTRCVEPGGAGDTARASGGSLR